MPPTRRQQSPIRQSTAVIAVSRPCVKCKYDLIGLRMGERCPECGTPIRSPRERSRFVDNLVDADAWYIRVVALGFVLLGVAMLAMGTWLVYVQYRAFQWAWVPPAVIGGVMAAVLVMWWAGVFLVTWRRPLSRDITRDPILEHRGLRWVIRGVHLLPLLAAGAIVAAVALGGGVLGVVAAVLTVASLFAMAPLCVYLSSLADWAGDTGAGSRLRGSAWLVGVCGTASLVFSGLSLVPGNPLRLPCMALAVISGILSVIGVVLFLASIWQLANVALWALFNKTQAKARELRIMERKAQAEEEQAARDALAEATLGQEVAPSGAVRRVDPLYGADDEQIPLVGPDAPARAQADAEADFEARLDGLSATAAPRITHRPGLGQAPAPRPAIPRGPTPDAQQPPAPGSHVIRPAAADASPYDIAPDDE